jgi:histidine triad (HIT) family protein
VSEPGNDCVFCKIVNGTIPARKVYEDKLVVAFWDARPAAPIHILVVPRKHLPTLNDVAEGDPLVSHMAWVGRQIAADFGVAEYGYRFFFNVNRGGGQVVFHLHAHVMAGNDLGTVFIKAAIVLSVLWRKLVSMVRGNRSRGR